MAQAQLPVGYPLTTAITYFNLCKNLMETDAGASSCKRMLREERAMHSRLHDTYLPELMWRRQFGGPVAFGNVLKHIAEQHPV